MSPALARAIAAALVGVLGLLGTVGVPGIGDLDMGDVEKTATLVVGAVIGGAMFIRQHWVIGSKASTQPVKHIYIESIDVKKVK